MREEVSTPRVVMTEGNVTGGRLEPVRGLVAPYRREILIILISIAITMVLTAVILKPADQAQAQDVARIYAPIITPQAVAAPEAMVAEPREEAQPMAQPMEAPAVTVSPVNNLPRPELAPIFPPNVQRYRDQIVDAAWEYDFDPNLLAIVVTVESCGNPNAVSRAGARGLAQVMPFHFAAGEDPFDIMTNLRRGANYFAAGLRSSGGDIGLTFAGYNGGHGRIQNGYQYWPAETRKYHQLTTAIYSDFINGLAESPTVRARCPY